MRWQPALKSFGFEYRAMNRIVKAHRCECLGEAVFQCCVEIRPRREHAVVICRRGPYLTKAAFGHQSLIVHGVPESDADGASVGTPVENGAYNLYFAGASVTVFAHVA